MKRILILPLFICSAAFGQGNKFHKLFVDANQAFNKSFGLTTPMTRLPVLNGTCLQYSSQNPKSVVIVLHGTGERGSDLTILEKIGFISNLKSGVLSTSRIILIPQLPSGAGGWYGNFLAPVIAYAQTFKLPIDISGYSLGGIGVSDNIGVFPVFRSAMSACGRVQPPEYQYYQTIPSIHYYDPADGTVQYGYGSILDLVTKLQAGNKKDISLITYPGKGHNVWDTAFSAANYWAWLDALDTPVVIPAPDPVISTIFDGTNVIETTQSGKVITIKPTTVN